jgi:hypothetical protein
MHIHAEYVAIEMFQIGTSIDFPLTHAARIKNGSLTYFTYLHDNKIIFSSRMHNAIISLSDSIY